MYEISFGHIQEISRIILVQFLETGFGEAILIKINYDVILLMTVLCKGNLLHGTTKFEAIWLLYIGLLEIYSRTFTSLKQG